MYTGTLIPGSPSGPRSPDFPICPYKNQHSVYVRIVTSLSWLKSAIITKEYGLTKGPGRPVNPTRPSRPFHFERKKSHQSVKFLSLIQFKNQYKDDLLKHYLIQKLIPVWRMKHSSKTNESWPANKK